MNTQHLVLVRKQHSTNIQNSTEKPLLINGIGFLPARRYASAGYRDRNVSVRLSVRHAPVLCQNEES